ncbi:hypothetical protein [Nonomuraea rhodomycinica]|uniref:Uncharacterized protein n=1 Tax=Nonomuraea rhodomycinica TaxID=1712872 RepID=A0A7Y6MF30_9ACTN|nr:hypothetical protein [Nonomuraea rhodomycinica]NUW45572.1 hypothetical protein [Nonomuraea rhodomycinica]
MTETALRGDEAFALTTLREMIVSLQDHIDRRAAEIAAPRITTAEQAAADAKAETERTRQSVQTRLDDLRQEFDRQDSVQRRELARMAARAEHADAVIAAARERHPSADELAKTNSQSGRYCPTCITLAPCDTRQILDGQEPDHA